MCRFRFFSTQSLGGLASPTLDIILSHDGLVFLFFTQHCGLKQYSFFFFSHGLICKTYREPAFWLVWLIVMMDGYAVATRIYQVKEKSGWVSDAERVVLCRRPFQNAISTRHGCNTWTMFCHDQS